MRWISSEGGPLLLLNERSLHHWGGVFDPIAPLNGERGMGPNGSYTDYDRACRIKGYLGRIAIADAEGLVLADDPMATTWVSKTLNGGMLVRWMFGENEEEFMRHLLAIPENIFQPDCQFYVEGDGLVLFDSALAGRDMNQHPTEYLSIELKRAIYEIKTAEYQPDNRTSMVVHSFVAR